MCNMIKKEKLILNANKFEFVHVYDKINGS